MNTTDKLQHAEAKLHEARSILQSQNETLQSQSLRVANIENIQQNFELEFSNTNKSQTENKELTESLKLELDNSAKQIDILKSKYSSAFTYLRLLCVKQ